METEQIEAELQGRRPRSIETRQSGVTKGIGCLRVFLIPFILVGLGTFLVALQGSIVALMGITVPAQVTTREVHSDSDSTSYHINYTYQNNGAMYYGSNQVSFDEYNAIHEGDRVNIKILPSLPKTSPMLMTGGVLPTNNRFMWFFTLVWNAIIFAFIWFAFIAPLIIRQLYLSGEATIGKLVEKTVSKGEDSDTYLLHYVFEVPDGPTYTNGLIRGKFTVTQQDWAEAQIDAKYTVLYDPKKPNRSVLYRFGPYRVL